MLYHIETEERGIAGHSSTVYTLLRGDGRTQIEVWPDFGFNCLKWQVDGQNLLYSMPDWQENPLPTRSGIPILFPFPNRIRDGVFVYRDRPYRLPKNDSTHSNAIHGFTPRNRWKVFGYSSDLHSAWIHADFNLAEDASEAAGFWPGNLSLSVIYRLLEHRLRIEIYVKNQDSVPVPFGIGLHPYFRLPVADPDISRHRLFAPARHLWELANSLPTGEKIAIPDELNWNRPRPIGMTQLDTLYADLGSLGEHNGLLHRATLSHDDCPKHLEFWTSPDFRESVLFTPVHRQAVCFEPYTCSTDAINLNARGLDAGWRELPPGGQWQGVVEFVWRGE